MKAYDLPHRWQRRIACCILYTPSIILAGAIWLVSRDKGDWDWQFAVLKSLWNRTEQGSVEKARAAMERDQ